MIDFYPKAKYVPANPANVGGVLDPVLVRLFVIHIAQGWYQSGLDAWFANPAASVSAHFSISRLGVVHQHVPLTRVAWAEMEYNNVAWSIEHLGYSGDKMPYLQRRASMRLIWWLHEQAPHVPLKRTGDPNGHGVIGHGELGVAGGDHPDCPGWPILAQFNIGLRPRNLKRWR